MLDTRSIFFWMGGVLTQSIEPLLRSAFTAYGQPEPNLFSISGFASTCEQFSLGQMKETVFCQSITELVHGNIPANTLQEAAISSFSPIPQVCSTIQQLPQNYARWLIVDYPHSWFEQIRGRLQIDSCFSSKHFLFLHDYQLPRLLPDIFDLLVTRSGNRRDQCLVVDANSHRTVAALDHGLPAAIFVDASRLEREFVMRQFTARVPLEHRPTTVIQGSDH